MKCESKEGRVRRVVRARSGCTGACGNGDEVPLGGAEGHMLSGEGEPCGDGRGEGGAAAFTVEICGKGAALAFLRGGGTVELEPEGTSIPSIKSSDV